MVLCLVGFVERSNLADLLGLLLPVSFLKGRTMSKDTSDNAVGGHFGKLCVNFLIDSHFFRDCIRVRSIKVKQQIGISMHDNIDLPLAVLDHGFGDAVRSTDDYFVDPLASQDTEDTFLQVHQRIAGTFDAVDGLVVVDPDEQVVALLLGQLEKLSMSNIYTI